MTDISQEWDDQDDDSLKDLLVSRFLVNGVWCEIPDDATWFGKDVTVWISPGTPPWLEGLDDDPE